MVVDVAASQPDIGKSRHTPPASLRRCRSSSPRTTRVVDSCRGDVAGLQRRPGRPATTRGRVRRRRIAVVFTLSDVNRCGRGGFMVPFGTGLAESTLRVVAVARAPRRPTERRGAGTDPSRAAKRRLRSPPRAQPVDSTAVSMPRRVDVPAHRRVALGRGRPRPSSPFSRHSGGPPGGCSTAPTPIATAC